MSRYKCDQSREFIPGYKFGGGHWRSVAVQFVSEPEIYHGAGFKLLADARVRAQLPLQISLECRGKSKKCDKQLTHIVRVSGAFFIFVVQGHTCHSKHHLLVQLSYGKFQENHPSEKNHILLKK